jgi:hypothetical protein
VINDFNLSRECASDLSETMCIGTPFCEDDHNDLALDVYTFTVTLYSIFAEPNRSESGPIQHPMLLVMKVSKGDWCVRKLEIPDYHWWLIVKGWALTTARSREFHALINAFYRSHRYILEVANRIAVLQYEEKVFGKFNPSKRAAWKVSK